MSRIGKQPIIIPEDVEVKLVAGTITVKGPKGELTQDIHQKINIKQKDNQLTISVKNPEDKKQQALWGLFKKIIENLVIGVTQGFSKQLEINGVGFKVAVQSDKLILNVGYSHPVEYQIPAGIEIKVEKNIITVAGIDKKLVGQTAAEIRAIRKPEPYKGKGIKYIDEVVRRKVGKVAVKTE